MLLARLIYSSTHQIETGTKDILHILRESREGNSLRGITGLLLYDTRFFMQWVEGPRDMVSDVVQRVFNDRRHSHTVILAYEEITKREFTEWSMGYVNMQSIASTIIFKYFSSQEFNPYSLSSTAATQFLIEMARYMTDPEMPS